MAQVNTKKSAMFLSASGTVPTAPAGFIESTEEIIPNIEIGGGDFKRINGYKGQGDTYTDTDDVTLSYTLNHNVRTQNKDADALDTTPEYGELLKVCGFDEVEVQRLYIASTTGLSVGDTVTGDTSSATGTVLRIIADDNILVSGVTGTFEAETLNTAAYTVSSAGVGVCYVNGQTTTVGSAAINIDGKQHTATSSIVGDLTMNMSIGEPVTLSVAMSMFLDNKGVASSVALPQVTLSEEQIVLMGYSDIGLAGGTSIEAKTFTISQNAEINKRYGLGRKQYTQDDYDFKLSTTFNIDDTNYNTAINKLIAETTEDILIKLKTDVGSDQSGKTIEIYCPVGKAATSSQSGDNSEVERTFEWKLQNKNQIFIYNGFYS